MSAHPRLPEWAQHPEPRFATAAVDEIGGLQCDIDEIADWLRSITQRDPEDFATPGWRAELRELVKKLEAARREFS